MFDRSRLSIISAIILGTLSFSMLFTGCSGNDSKEAAENADESAEVLYDDSNAQEYDEDMYIDKSETEYTEINDESVALASSPSAVDISLNPVASGSLVKKTSDSEIDYSNTKDGYIMIKYTGSTSKKLKVQVKGPSTTYTYNLTPDSAWEIFPLTDGNGSYTASVFENIEGTKYACVSSVSFNVSLTDEFAPYIRPNQYVDYSNAPNTIAKAAEITSDVTDTLDKVQVIYDYVVSNISYDKEKAATVQSGYLPVLDTILSQKKGICFDYAALMTGMLRSQGIPCKLIVGYAGTEYHAWISVYSEETGWIEGAIHFNGRSWERMDPTFASTGNNSESVIKYISDSSHYNAKYQY